LRIPSAATALGKASYATYLVHLLAIGVAYKCLMKIGVGPSLKPQVFLGLLVAFAVFTGMCVSRWIEQPLLVATA
jgi:peptidoglycan/LPS O-acetylase OafA/YrhL